MIISACFSRMYHYVTENLWKMPKTYSIGVNRYVVVKKQDNDLNVTIAESGSDVKTVIFPSQRWVQFVGLMDQVDEAVSKLIAKQDVQLNLHIGGKWYISVTTGFACVDIRQYYYHSTKGPSPSKTGIALRLPEWIALKENVQQLHKKHVALTIALPCTYQLDHQNLEGALSCTECHPFQHDELLRSLNS
jgi:hypothetical protein